MSSKIKQRNNTVDFLKGIAIIVVVIGHVISSIYAPENFADNFIYKICYSFHMPLFMILSGYVEGYNDIRIANIDRIKRKIKRLVIPWLVWTLIHILFNGNISLLVLIDQLFLNPFLWYLLIVFYFFVVFYLCNRFPIKCTVYFLIFIWALNYLLMLKFRNIAFFVYYANHFPFYIMGYYLNQNFKMKEKISSVYFLPIIIYPISMSFYTYGGTSETAQQIQIFLGIQGNLSKMLIAFVLWEYNHHFVAFWGCCFVGSLTYLFYRRNFLLKTKKVIEYFGKNSIYIYLLHGFILRFFQQNISLTPPQNSILIQSIIAGIISIFIPCVIEHWVKNKKIGILFGEINKS